MEQRKGRTPATKTPGERLLANGAITNARVRKRLLWLGREWGIPPADIKAAMRCRTVEMSGFLKKYHVSADWLIPDDRKGLQRMMRDRRAGRSVCHPDMTGEEFYALVQTLPKSAQREIHAVMLRWSERAEP